MITSVYRNRDNEQNITRSKHSNSSERHQSHPLQEFGKP